MIDYIKGLVIEYMPFILTVLTTIYNILQSQNGFIALNLDNKIKNFQVLTDNIVIEIKGYMTELKAEKDKVIDYVSELKAFQGEQEKQIERLLEENQKNRELIKSLMVYNHQLKEQINDVTKNETTKE